MRTVALIPHPRLKISIFQYNDKYLIEMEGGPYKQTYKIATESVQSIEQLKSLCTADLIDAAIKRFNEMHADFTHAYKTSLGLIK